MILLIVTLFAACFFALNIGASGSAATMGIPYGAGVIRNKRTALIICGAGGLLGAVWGGGEVVETISNGLVPSSLLTLHAVIIILFTSAATLFFTNLAGIPLSTSEVTVGSIIGVGISFQQLQLGSLIHIISFWIIVPVAAFLFTFLVRNGLRIWKNRRAPGRKWHRQLAILLVVTGFIEAFAAGMNNVANAIGPLVGAQVMDKQTGLLTGGIFIALGSILLGGRVLETNGKRISNLTVGDGVIISGTSGFLVFLASLMGIPIPMTQVTTSAIVGVDASKNWKETWRKKVIHQIAKVWVSSPVVSLVLAYCLTEVFLRSSFYTVAMIASGIFATLILTNFKGTSFKNQKKEHHSLNSEFH
ncbi:inorganic phosphate transporter [Sediminibacillus massiliensis]|uniref:inorganic phosphate transporter n=1 Tax=Sediminibacillus massiliensis TaxID=1926277 RepID=UPI0009888F3C|nr:inorganic phosphate transporter [Sediminibacillus massiliensis]